jgi:hypothetical protein
MKIPQQHELIGFFESEPELLDASAAWAYNRLTFRTVSDDEQIEFVLEPANGELRLSWSQRGRSLLDIDLNEVDQISVESERGRETLVAALKGAYGGLRLRLRPQIHVFLSHRR